MATKQKKRNIPVDTLRGLACIMLVACHVIGLTPETGLRLHEGTLKDANALLACIRMPLITFLSGLVYAWRPFSGDWKPFINGKIRRLIIPMLVIGTTFALFQAFTPGTNHQEPSPIALLLTKAESKPFAAIVNDSCAIYLFHVFFTAASRIIPIKTGLTNIWELFIAGTIASIAGSIIIELLTKKHKTTRALLIGRS